MSLLECKKHTYTKLEGLFSIDFKTNMKISCLCNRGFTGDIYFFETYVHCELTGDNRQFDDGVLIYNRFFLKCNRIPLSIVQINRNN